MFASNKSLWLAVGILLGAAVLAVVLFSTQTVSSDVAMMAVGGMVLLGLGMLTGAWAGRREAVSAEPEEAAPAAPRPRPKRAKSMITSQVPLGTVFDPDEDDDPFDVAASLSSIPQPRRLRQAAAEARKRAEEARAIRAAQQGLPQPPSPVPAPIEAPAPPRVAQTPTPSPIATPIHAPVAAPRALAPEAATVPINSEVPAPNRPTVKRKAWPGPRPAHIQPPPPGHGQPARIMSSFMPEQLDDRQDDPFAPVDSSELSREIISGLLGPFADLGTGPEARNELMKGVDPFNNVPTREISFTDRERLRQFSSIDGTEGPDPLDPLSFQVDPALSGVEDINAPLDADLEEVDIDAEFEQLRQLLQADELSRDAALDSFRSHSDD